MRQVTNILRNPNRSEIRHAIEYNFYKLARSMSTLDLEDMVSEDTDIFFRYSTGINFFLINAVIESQIPPEVINQKIKENISFFEKRRVPFLWVIGPSSRPKNLGELLIKNGFVLSKEPGMACDLNSLEIKKEPLNKIEIVKVENFETLKVWNDVFFTGFGLPKEDLSDFFNKSFSFKFLSDKPSASGFLAYHDGIPVGTSLVFYEAGVAGIYNVSTLEQARGNGIGTAITLAPLNEAKNLGYQIGTLQSSDMALNMYKQMGFKEYCQMEWYVWQPSLK